MAGGLRAIADGDVRDHRCSNSDICRASALPQRTISEVSPNLMLGVNATTDSVSRLEKVAWRRTLGWTTLRVGNNPYPLRRGLLEASSEDEL